MTDTGPVPAAAAPVAAPGGDQVVAPGAVPARVAEAAARASGLAGTTLAEHAAVYQHIHEALQDALAEIDGG